MSSNVETKTVPLADFIADVEFERGISVSRATLEDNGFSFDSLYEMWRAGYSSDEAAFATAAEHESMV